MPTPTQNEHPYYFRFNESSTIQEELLLPVTDAHMHIQSNDIAPLPIMYGVLNYKVSKMLHEKTNSEMVGKINFVELPYLEEKEENKEKIAPVAEGGPFLCDFANSDIKLSVDNAMKELPRSISNAITILAAVLGTVLGIKFPSVLPALIIAVQQFVDSQINPRDVRKKRLFLTDLTALFVKNYGKIARQNSFFVAGLYKNDAIKESDMGINSRVGIDLLFGEGVLKGRWDRENLVRSRIRQRDLFYKVSRHYYQNPDAKLVPSFSMSVIHGMELMFAHYWGAYGIPIYIPYKKEEEELYYIADNLVNPNNSREMLYNIYDADNNAVKSLVNKDEQALPFADAILDNGQLVSGKAKYIHFLKKAPVSEKRQFEDLLKHVDYTEAAAVRYPLQYLPFYHVDPRRFFAPPIDAIFNYNDFYICNDDGSFTETISEETDKTGEVIKINKIKDSLENSVSFKYRMDIAEVKSKLIYKDKDNGEWHKGLFWGIKMYAALGYPPYLCINEEARKVFRCLKPKDYEKLFTELYEFCADCEVPITCHGSPQGMTIADPGTYLKEYLKDHGSGTGYDGKVKSSFPVDGKSFMHGIGLIDSFSSPKSWKLVLNALGEKKDKLRLCLAHFGGRGFFWKYKDSPYDWLVEIAGLINEFEGVYTDISNFGFDSFVHFPEQITPSLFNSVKKRPNNFIEAVYKRSRDNYAFEPDRIDEKDMALLRLDIILEASKLEEAELKFNAELNCYKKMHDTAKKIADLINADENERLQHRIMFGTDWPMCEMDVKGVLKYSSAMFVLLQLVTVFLDNEWDAWHQFTVINPLRFLGLLLEGPENNSAEYQLNIVKIDQMKEAIDEYLSGLGDVNSVKSLYHQRSYCITSGDVRESLNSQYQHLTRIAEKTIPSADLVTDADNRLLLTNMKRVPK
jgi:predicted TIM-barrel fold metal-dependent hydrolase